MQTLFYSLIILSGILGLIVGGLGGVLTYLLKSSYINTDQAWGWAILLCSLCYASHPALIYWLFKNGHSITAIGTASFFIICSGLLIFVLPSAIEAGARP